MLFQNKQATKVYECLASCAPIRRPRFGTITQAEPPRPFPLLRRSHITKERGTLAAFEEPGAVSAETLIERGELILPSAGGRWREAPEGEKPYATTPQSAVLFYSLAYQLVFAWEQPTGLFPLRLSP